MFRCRPPVRWFTLVWVAGLLAACTTGGGAADVEPIVQRLQAAPGDTSALAELVEAGAEDGIGSSQRAAAAAAAVTTDALVAMVAAREPSLDQPSDGDRALADALDTGLVAFFRELARDDRARATLVAGVVAHVRVHLAAQIDTHAASGTLGEVAGANRSVSRLIAALDEALGSRTSAAERWALVFAAAQRVAAAAPLEDGLTAADTRALGEEVDEAATASGDPPSDARGELGRLLHEMTARMLHADPEARAALGDGAAPFDQWVQQSEAAADAIRTLVDAGDLFFSLEDLAGLG